MQRAKETDWWHISILPHEVEWVEKNAAARTENAKKSGMKTRTKDRDPKWDISGLAGELAVSLMLCMPVGRIVGSTRSELNSGDIGDFIEVKSSISDAVNKRDLIVNKDHLNEKRVYVSTLTHLWPERVVIQGWQYGTIFKTHGTPMRGVSGQDIIVVKSNLLLRPIDLFDAVREKQRLASGFGT